MWTNCLHVIVPFSLAFSSSFLPSHLIVYRSRLPLLVHEFLPLALRYPVFIYASFYLLFFLFLVRHIPRHGSFHLLSSPRLRSVFPLFISLWPHHSRLPVLPLAPLFSATSAETYFLETSEFTCSKSLRFDRSVVSQLTKSGFALCIHLRFAKSRSHTSVANDHLRHPWHPETRNI